MPGPASLDHHAVASGPDADSGRRPVEPIDPYIRAVERELKL
jgi:hypothetical protein